MPTFPNTRVVSRYVATGHDANVRHSSCGNFAASSSGQAALAPRASSVDVSKQSSNRPPDDEPQVADDRRPRQPRRVRAGLTRGPPDDALHEPVVDPANDRRLTKRQVAEREACSTRTIDRRVADGSLSPPDIINGRCYWWLSVEAPRS